MSKSPPSFLMPLPPAASAVASAAGAGSIDELVEFVLSL